MLILKCCREELLGSKILFEIAIDYNIFQLTLTDESGIELELVNI
jgi:hypothetical protein